MGLKKLLVSEEKVTEEVLERILGDFVRLAQDTRKVIFTPSGAHLPARPKVLLVLAAQHAWRFIQPGGEGDPTLTVAEIGAQTGLPGNTLRPVLKQLKDSRILEIPSKGVYRLPPHSLPQVEREIEEVRQKPRQSEPPRRKRARVRRASDTGR